MCRIIAAMQDVAGALLEAITLQQAARHAEAETLYQRVLADCPDEPRAVYLYGLLQLGTGRTEAAARSLARAVALRPTHLDARLSLGRALLAEGDAAPALVAAEVVLERDPANAQARYLRGSALYVLGEKIEAVAALRQAIAADSGNAAAHLHLANALMDLDQLAAAEAACRDAVRHDPTLLEAQVSLGFILTGRGRLPEAIAACEAALALQPGCPQAHWNLAVAALLAGDYARGFAEYEWRKRHDRYRRDFVDLPGPVWTGDDPAGRTILVHAEQGFGDTIQFARYLPLIAARGAQVVLVCDERLVGWLGTLRGVAAAVPFGGALPRYDAWIDQMSLPHVFATQSDTVPDRNGYLVPEPVLAAGWAVELPAGRRVGLAWAGNPLHSNDARRSLPADAARALCAAPGVHFVNLQVGPRATEAGLPDLSLRLTDYAVTAALVANLDLVVTVDTSIAHVAGALGVPCWVMLPFAPDWRWGLRRDDNAWYSTLRLFRQTEPGGWGGVIASVTASLACAA